LFITDVSATSVAFVEMTSVSNNDILRRKSEPEAILTKATDVAEMLPKRQ